MQKSYHHKYFWISVKNMQLNQSCKLYEFVHACYPAKLIMYHSLFSPWPLLPPLRLGLPETMQDQCQQHGGARAARDAASAMYL
jgi:hypothetical protein